MRAAKFWAAQGAPLLLTLPWLVPPQQAPSPAVIPWLVTLACASLLVLSLGEADERGVPEGDGTLGQSVALAWLTAAVISTFIGLCQYFNIEDIFFWMTSADPGQIYGNLRQRNQYATLTNIGLAAVLWWAASDAARGRWTSGFALMGAVLAAGNAASGSRAGLVELLFVSVLYLWWSRQAPRNVGRQLVATWMAYALAASLLAWRAEHGAAVGGILARAHDGLPACATRPVMWQNVLELIWQRPWSGWGWGELDYAHFISDYRGMRECELIDNAHNLFLHLAVELGVPVSLLVLGLVFYGVWKGKPWRERDRTRQLLWAVLGLILLHSMVEYPLWYGPFMLSACLAGFLLCFPCVVWTRALAAQGGGVARSAMMLAGFTLLGVVYAAWDYQRVSQIYLPPEQRAASFREHTLAKIQDSWLFRDQVRFAEYSITPLTMDSAPRLLALGSELLHYSPEPRVVEKLIESARLLGRGPEASYYEQRYRTVYPDDYQHWAARQAAVVSGGTSSQSAR